MNKLSIPKIIDNKLEIKPPRKSSMYKIPYGMAFVSANNKQVCTYVGCRDYLQDIIRTYLNNKKRLSSDGHPYYPGLKDPDLCMDRLRLMFCIDKKKLKGFIRALKVLNCIEIYADIEKTIAEFVYLKNELPINTTILLRGSGEYMKNPHLLSLLTLIIRFCVYNPRFKFEQINDLSRAFKSMVKRKTIKKDRHLMNECHGILHKVLKERKNIFKECSLEELFPIDIKGNFHSQGGIFALCCASSPNEKVNKKIVELKRKVFNI